MSKTFNLLSIVFRFIKHYYDYFLVMLNSLYCAIPIERNQLVTAGIYINHALTTVPVDIISCLKAEFIANVKSICDGDGTNAENILS